MGRLGVVITIFLVVFELALFLYYYKFLVPAYNLKEYTEKPVVDPSTGATCSIFLTQNEAQSFYLKNSSTINLGALDHDKDGVVCENLP